SSKKQSPTVTCSRRSGLASAGARKAARGLEGAAVVGPAGDAGPRCRGPGPVREAEAKVAPGSGFVKELDPGRGEDALAGGNLVHGEVVVPVALQQHRALYRQADIPADALQHRHSLRCLFGQRADLTPSG